MAKKKKPRKWYAWRDALGNGGICRTWAECQAASSGKSGDKHQGFDTKEEAWAFAYPGIPMPFENDIVDTSGASQQLQEDHGSVQPPVQIDPARISHTKPCEKVNQFCSAYGFTKFSEDQRRAVQTVDGKVLLFAVPGSGKTTVLIARVGYMIHACGIAPETIVSLTFTKASAAEMNERYQNRFPNDAALPEFRTIHSFAYTKVIPMLRQAGYSVPRNKICDEIEKTKQTGKKKKKYETLIFSEINDGLKEIVEHAQNEKQQEKKAFLLHGREDCEDLQTAITGIKNTQMTREQLKGRTIHLHSGRDLPIDRAYDVYMDLCRKYDCMDFDDMLILALEGLKQHPEVLSKLQQQYRYWSIDESQDNSPLQHELLQLLVGQHGNLFMVGDDDQSIYAFRGAKPSLFQQFGMEPDVTVLTMGINYRSDFGIVKTAETFISRNSSHQNKQMRAFQAGKGRIRFIYDLHTEKRQYERIVETARNCNEHHQGLAVLYRENISALPVMFWLDKYGLPFSTAAKPSELLQYPSVNTILKLLEFAVRPNSFKLCLRVCFALNIFPSEEVKKLWKEKCSAAPKRNVLDVLSEIDNHDYSSQMNLLCRTAQATPRDAICMLIQGLEYIKLQRQSERMQVNAILSMSILYQSISEMLSAIAALKKKLKDDGNEDEDDDEEMVISDSTDNQQESSSHAVNAVTLATMHSAKGREFDHVMIIDFLAPPDIPYNSDQLTFDDPEEPRRLFYVAMTRAKHALDILTVQFYHGLPEVPHPFINEYASICDQEGLLTEYEASVPETSDGIPVQKPKKYYGVRVGRKPGIYDTWDEANEQVNGFSNAKQQSFLTWEEAAKFTYPNGIPDQVRPVDLSVFRQYLVTSPTLRSNWSKDIPSCITKGILGLLHTDSLESLSLEMRKSLSMDYLTAHHGACNYGGMKALAYTVNYLPLNYYKVWTPLWKLLEEKRLPYHAKVLELGPGPGTAGIALIDFYSKLASGNPNIRFSVDYTAVERERDFQQIWEHLVDKITLQLPVNFRVTTKLVTADAFDFIRQIPSKAFDVIIESNMLNQDEAISDANLGVINEGLAQGLTDHGYGILIEPGKKDQLPVLKKATANNKLKLLFDINLTSVDITCNTLVKQCLDAGIRYKEKKEHWYSYAVVERKLQ